MAGVDCQNCTKPASDQCRDENCTGLAKHLCLWATIGHLRLVNLQPESRGAEIPMMYAVVKIANALAQLVGHFRGLEGLQRLAAAFHGFFMAI